MTDGAAKILSCGNCDPDHGALTEMLTSHFAVEIERASTRAEVLERLAAGRYDLILMNRLFFHDGTEALGLLDEVRRGAGDDTPVMVVSNFRDAQAAAVEAGAVMGFGKAELGSAETRARLRAHLPARA